MNYAMHQLMNYTMHQLMYYAMLHFKNYGIHTITRHMCNVHGTLC
jgi:hypothetical protein